MTSRLALLFPLLLATSAASAHDVRMRDGSLWVHDHHSAFFKGAGVRNVSVTAPQVTDCERATWPDIPAACFAEQATQPAPSARVSTAKGARVVVVAAAGVIPN